MASHGSGSAGSQQLDVVGLVRGYSRPSAAIEGNPKFIAKFLEVCKAYLRQKAKELVLEAKGAPILVHYSSDGTPLSTKRTITAGQGQDYTVRRQGRDTEEFLVQHTFVRFLDGLGRHRTAMVLREPLPLTEGKSGLALFSAAVEFNRTARELGHTGISVAHYSFDRAAYSAVGRYLKQHHKLLEPSFDGSAQGLTREALSLSEWVVCSPCALHDGHKSLSWAMRGQFSNTQLMNDIYIVIAAVRNSFGLLHLYLAPWLSAKLTFVADELLPSMDDRALIWTALGAEPALVQQLAFELRLQWKDDQLQIAASCAELEDNLLEKLTAALLGLWEFRQFSASRWATVGTSCRGLVAAMLSGFESLVSQVRNDPKASDFHLHGFTKLTLQAKRFVATAALASYVPEGFLLQLMHDSRVPLRCAELEEALGDEVSYLANMKDVVWDTLAETCSMSGGELRSEVLGASHISIGFLQSKVLQEAKAFPWCLGYGDQPSKLSALKAGPQPEEPVTAKIWQLLQLGFNEHQLKRGLELLMDCPWGTATVERQHASATLVKKHHPEYGTESLVSRAFFHTLRLCLPGQSPEEKRLAAQQRKLDKLVRKAPQRITGRQVFVKDLMAQASERKARGKETPASVNKTIIKRHGPRWQQMGPRGQEKYNSRAALERSAAQQRLSAEVTAQSEAIALAASRLTARQDERPPLTPSEARLSLEDFSRIGMMMCSPSFTDKAVSALRQAAVIAPPLPNPTTVSAMAAVPLYGRKVAAERPAWLPPLCWHRDFFQNCAFLFEGPNGTEWFKFLYASQSPLFACFSKLTPMEFFLPVERVTGKNWVALSMAHREFRFHTNFMESCPWHELPPVPLECVKVLMGLEHAGGDAVVSSSSLLPLPDVMSWLPAAKEPKQSEGQQATPSKVVAAPALLEEHPFLKGFLALHAKDSCSDQASSSSQPPPNTEQPAVEDEAFEELCKELDAKRLEWASEGQGYQDVFQVTLLGGAWLIRREGRTIEGFKAAPKVGSEAEAWLVQYGFTKSASYFVSVYGEQLASAMAHEWAHRMYYYFSLWEASGDPSYRYTAEDVANYVEHPTFTAAAQNLAGRQLTRVEALRALRPS
jgi:hypothetical protein